MPADISALANAPRLLIEVPLRPLAGSRFQPTGFPDLGPALFDSPPASDVERGSHPNGVPTLLVESAQSMANRLEAACWSEADEDLAPELKGLPYVRVSLVGLSEGTDSTSSILEFHRLNSPYITSATTAEGVPFVDALKSELKLGTTRSGEDGKEAEVAGVVNLRRLAQVAFKYDPNSLVHGLFLEKIAGRLRHPRSLSAFIEARGVERADSGGVKFDRALPKPSVVAGLDAKGGYGNVPFSRSEFTAREITAYFSLDLAQIRGYGLGEDASSLLAAFSLWKVRRLLETGLRLRTACDLEPIGDLAAITARRPDGFLLPSASDLSALVGELIVRCKPLFADPAVTELTWAAPEKKKSKPKTEAKPK